MRRLMQWGGRNPFLASLILSVLLIAVSVSLVSLEGRQRVDDVKRLNAERIATVQQLERDRAVAVLDVCQDVVNSVNATIGAILSDIRESSEARGQTESPTLDRLDAINDQELHPDKCLAQDVTDPVPSTTTP